MHEKNFFRNDFLYDCLHDTFLYFLGGFIVILVGAIISSDPWAWISDIIIGINALMFFFLFGYLSFRYVVIDKEKIIAKNLFGKMREITWEEVREVRIEKVMYDPRKKPIGWLIFIEKKAPNRRYIGGGMTKKSCIKIRYKPENEEFLRQCRPDVKFVNYIDGE